MSPSAGEQRALSYIADELAASDPKPASILAVFNRLMWGSAARRRRQALRAAQHQRALS